MNLQRVLIIGISGTGKSWLARQLGDRLGLPVIHMDQLIWEKHWVEKDWKRVEQETAEVLKKDRWILEGWIEPHSKTRLAKADLVLYLDYSGWRAMVGGLRRWWKHRGQTRPEMPEGNIENFDWQYLQTMRRRDERPEIERAIMGFEKKIIRSRSPRETNRFLFKLSKRTV